MTKDVSIDVEKLKEDIESKTASLFFEIKDGFEGKCPAHEDTGRSLKLTQLYTGQSKISCKEGCSLDSIFNALDMTPLTKERYNSFPTQDKKKNSGLCVIGIKEFLSQEILKKEMILSPFLTTQGIVLIYARRGVGKTHVSLGIAYAIASGGKFLKWKSPTPRRVLFLDGEMTQADMHERLEKISLVSDTPIPSNDFFRLITPDLQEDPLPNLSNFEGREKINNLTDTFDVIIIDNLSSLFRSSFENEADSWQVIQDWLLELRKNGKSIILIHHAGKSGKQRGTSKREDVADTVICLKNPEGYRPEEGACFEVHFEKTRHFSGMDAEPFTAKMIEADDGLLWWEVSSSEADKEIELVANGIKAGLTIEQIKEKTGLSKSQVETRKKKAKNLGLIK